MEDNIQGRRPQRNKTIEQFYLQNYRQFELSLALLSPKLSFLFTNINYDGPGCSFFFSSSHNFSTEYTKIINIIPSIMANYSNSLSNSFLNHLSSLIAKITVVVFSHSDNATLKVTFSFFLSVGFTLTSAWLCHTRLFHTCLLGCS